MQSLEKLTALWNSQLDGKPVNAELLIPSLRKLLDGELTERSEILQLALQSRDSLAPLCHVSKKHLRLTKLAESKKIKIGEFQVYSRMLAPHYRPPPEYDDPTGQDANCIPGYYFPCPDITMIMRSILHEGNKDRASIRCLPPKILYSQVPGNRNLYKLSFTAEIPGSLIKYSIDLDPYSQFKDKQPPVLRGNRDYGISAYCTAPNYLPSAVEYRIIKLSANDQEDVAVESQYLPSLFIDDDLESEDDLFKLE